MKQMLFTFSNKLAAIGGRAPRVKAQATAVLTALALGFSSLGASGQTLPLVYGAENTGQGCTAPPLPTFSQLPAVQPLPDPFMWSDGRGRSTSFSDWECRRNEIKAEVENYEIGTKPTRPQNITASYAAGVLTVTVTENGQTLTLTSQVALPAAGTGPFPAIIGMNSPSGSVPASVFTGRNIARITFNHNQVTTYGNPQLTDPYYRLYPSQNLSNSGQYSAWAWGVSRIIDGLELVQASLPINLRHLGVTGCSYAGKMALFSGAFDERIALTIAQESGGGGAPAWRVSETLGAVEKLGATDYKWFRDDMVQFAGTNVAKLPHDHHELMAMIAPRALLVTGNTDFEWLANPAAYVSARAAHEVWKQFGVADRFGFYIDGSHGHCAVPATQLPAMQAFVDKFLVGDASVNTNITVHPYPQVDYQRWYKWWGTNNPVLPAEPLGKRIWLEAECATVGSSWQTLTDAAASKQTYVVVNGLNSTAAAPAGANAAVVFPFAVDSAATYNYVARLNCPTANDDSYWVKVDNGPFVTVNGLTTSGWQWMRLTSANLGVGPHTFTIAYREDGAKLDKLLVTTSNATITGLGATGINCGQAPVITPGQSFSVSEIAANASPVGTVQATDADADTKLQQWQITGGTGAGAFAVNAATGALAVLDNSGIDFESATRSYTLSLTVTDGYFRSATETVVVNLTNANDNAPVVNSGLSLALDGGTCNELGRLTATDADDTNQPGFTTFQNWQITGGSGAGAFAVEPSTGLLTIADLQHADLTASSHTLQVTVGDGAQTSAPETVVITIPNKITICHKGQLISVSKMAAVGHLQHGDCIGRCGSASLTAAPGRAPAASSAISVYPNPANDNVSIDLGANSNHVSRVEVVDFVTGAVLSQAPVSNQSELTLQLHQLKPGIYWIRFTGDETRTQRLVIQ